MENCQIAPSHVVTVSPQSLVLGEIGTDLVAEKLLGRICCCFAPIFEIGTIHQQLEEINAACSCSSVLILDVG